MKPPPLLNDNRISSSVEQQFNISLQMLTLNPIQLTLAIRTTKPINQIYPGIVTRSCLSTIKRQQQQRPEVCVNSVRKAIIPKATCRDLVPYKLFVSWSPPTITVLVPLPDIIFEIGLPVPAPVCNKPRPAPSSAGALIPYKAFDFYVPIPSGPKKALTQYADSSLALAPYVPRRDAALIQAELRPDASLLAMMLLALILMSSLIDWAFDSAEKIVETCFYAEVMEEMARLTSLVEALEYKGENFRSSVCPPLAPTPFNMVALYRPFIFVKPAEKLAMADIILYEVVADLKTIFKPILFLLSNLFC